jgi:peptidyl-Asp metalloendopeptidase
MNYRRLFFLTLGMIFMSFATTSTRAQTTTPQHYLRERAVNRVRRFNSRAASAVSQASADQYLGKKRAAAVEQSMRLDLFEDVSFTVDLDHVEQQSGNNLAWSGKVRGAPLGSATFVRSGDLLTGSVTRGDGKIYQVRTDDDGTQWAVEIDQSKFPGSDEIGLPFSPPVVETASPLGSDLVAAADDGSTIDVMVVYTPGARQSVGGTTQMSQLVQLGIAETNTGYANSGVIQRIRLVYSGEVSYTESDSFNTDLTRLSTASDGFLDDIQNLRNAYGADIVSLWRTESASLCGIGWMLSTVNGTAAALSGAGFNVVSVGCATGYYSFGHEMGHNMGADHGKDDNAPGGPYSYGSGHKNTTGTKFRTIMAYDANCSCARINYWSNPAVQYSGSTTGVDSTASNSAANYLVLNNTRTIVGNFRSAVTGGGTVPTDATGPQLTISSHTNNQTVTTSSITISGTATDSGRGDSGILSVTVNGVAATGGTATGSATASWSRTVTLSSGANTITVVAKDNSAAQNSTTSTITVKFGTSSTTSTTSATASTYHVFPQFADGRFGDGTYYRTTLMIANPSSTATPSCTLQMRGFTVPGFATSYNMAGAGWVIAPTSGTQNFVSGYATLSCTANVEAQLLYSYYASNGVKISEATVFSSPPSNALGLAMDERDGARFAIAIANDSDRTITYNIIVNASGFSGSKSATLAARTSTAGFLGDLISGMPANSTAAVSVYASASTDSVSVIGLRYTGGVFTTMPASPSQTAGPTASAYHVFPQFADGRFDDGSYYRTGRLYLNPASSSTATCETRLRGMTTENSNLFTLSLPSNTSYISRTSGTQTFQSGYATLSCSGVSVYAQAVYSYYASNGIKLSEATVFSAPAVRNSQILADNREGSRVGLAIANDSDQATTYTITAYNSSGLTVGSTTKTLQPRTSTADFIDNWIQGIPVNYYGQVIVSATTGTGSVIGLRFTGSAFTTIPSIIR